MPLIPLPQIQLRVLARNIILGVLVLLSGCQGVTSTHVEPGLGIALTSTLAYRSTPTATTEVIPGQQSNPSKATPVLELEIPPTLTVPPPMATRTPRPTAPPTLEPTVAAQMIAELMRTNANCLQPCFWGMYPEVMELNEVIEFFTSLGSKVSTSSENDLRFYTSYSVKVKIYISIEFEGSNERLLNLHAGVGGLDYKEITIADWAAFRPDSILRAYGAPDQIGFFLSFPTEPTTEKLAFHDLVLVYRDYDFIIAYYDFKTEDKPFIHICPLLDPGYIAFDIWLGEGAENIPKRYVSLEEASGLTGDQFYTLLLGNPQSACLDLDVNAFIK